jgi:hypothetical protein
VEEREESQQRKELASIHDARRDPATFETDEGLGVFIRKAHITSIVAQDRTSELVIETLLKYV